MATNYSAAFLTKVFSLLNEKSEYAVLRNFEGLPDNNTARYIDIAISRKDYKAIKQPLIQDRKSVV